MEIYLKMTTFDELHDIIIPNIIQRIEQHQGLANFASIRAKYEGWLKVEICDILSDHFENVLPEQSRIDITFNDWAIELKTINTNYRHGNVKNMHRPITKNIEGIIDDINKLKRKIDNNSAVLFTVFPANENNQQWLSHSKKIVDKLCKVTITDFHFKNRVPGLIYFGLVREH